MSWDDDTGWRHQQAIVNGIRLHWVEQGEGPLVVLLHGFPEFWYSWRRQLPVLAERFRVVAPDMRGYNLSEKPAKGYDLQTLTDDFLALIHHFGEERADVAGATIDQPASGASLPICPSACRRSSSGASTMWRLG